MPEIDVHVHVDETATVEYDEDEVDQVIEKFGSLEEHALGKVDNTVLAHLAANFDEMVELTVVDDEDEDDRLTVETNGDTYVDVRLDNRPIASVDLRPHGGEHAAVKTWDPNGAAGSDVDHVIEYDLAEVDDD